MQPNTHMHTQTTISLFFFVFLQSLLLLLLLLQLEHQKLLGALAFFLIRFHWAQHTEIAWNASKNGKDSFTYVSVQLLLCIFYFSSFCTFFALSMGNLLIYIHIHTPSKRLLNWLKSGTFAYITTTIRMMHLQWAVCVQLFYAPNNRAQTEWKKNE